MTFCIKRCHVSYFELNVILFSFKYAALRIAFAVNFDIKHALFNHHHNSDLFFCRFITEVNSFKSIFKLIYEIITTVANIFNKL